MNTPHNRGFWILAVTHNPLSPGAADRVCCLCATEVELWARIFGT